jgi:hypothetical protein
MKYKRSREKPEMPFPGSGKLSLENVIYQSQPPELSRGEAMQSISGIRKRLLRITRKAPESQI